MNYKMQLESLVANYLKQQPANSPGAATEREVLDVNPDGTLTDEAARELHEALCRQKQMSAAEIIADWNRRSPEDTW